MQIFIVIFQTYTHRGAYTDDYRQVVVVAQTFILAESKEAAEERAHKLAPRDARVGVYGEGEVFEIGELPA